MSTGRHPTIDTLKVVASQLIVWHHLSAYGPVADALHAAWPASMDWLYDYGRMAVQVFLVLGGYLALPGLLRTLRAPWPVLPKAIGARYRRLAAPFLIAMLLAAMAGALTRPWLGAELAGDPVDAVQVLSHALLLHDVLGQASLSAGVWYVAIDFQLYALMALVLWLGLRTGRDLFAVALVALMCVASLLWWNRDSDLDAWAPYFMGAYALGALARTVQQQPSMAQRLTGAAALAALGGLALWLQWRTRITLATALALGLALAPQLTTAALPARLGQGLHAMGRSSYALFLLHYPVLLLGNAVWVAGGATSAAAATGMALAVWGLSVASGLLFERCVEQPLARRLRPG
ncbi:MAG: acyltransferase family protein [Hydrogenophaga sp.]